MFKVLYVIDTMRRMGTQVHIANMMRGHDRERFRPYLLCAQEKGILGEELEGEGYPVVTYGLTKMYGLEALRSYPRFVAFLRREKIDIVHCYLFGAQLYGVPIARFAGVPLVVAGRRAVGAYWTAPRDIRARRFANSFAHLQIGNSLAVKEFVTGEERVPPEKVRVVYNGVDASRFSPAAGAGADRPPRRPTIGYVGNFTEVKRVDLLLEAVKLALPRYPRLRLLLIGEGPTAARQKKEGGTDERLRSVITRLGLEEAVVFAGFSDRVEEDLREMDVFVLPSVSEGMSNAMLEAMAAGVPVVATDNGGNREVIVDGETGYLFPQGDAAGLAEILERLFSDGPGRREMGRKARRRILNHFTLEKMVREMESVYREELRRRVRS